MRVVMAWAQGDAEHAAQLLDQVAPEAEASVASYGAAAVTLAAMSRVTGETRWLKRAEQLAQTASQFASAINERTQRQIDTVASLVAIQRSDRARCERLYDTVSRWVMRSPLVDFASMSWQRLLALLAHQCGYSERALAHFEAAMAMSREKGYLPEHAWCCLDYAKLLVEEGLGNASDRAQARELLDEGIGLSRQLSMPLLEGQIDECLRAVERPRRRTPAQKPRYPDGLTRREVEVLRLVAQGMSNHEVAHTLVISTKTVATHLGNAYAKIGAANRAEASAYTAQRGLLEPG